MDVFTFKGFPLVESSSNPRLNLNLESLTTIYKLMMFIKALNLLLTFLIVKTSLLLPLQLLSSFGDHPLEKSYKNWKIVDLDETNGF